ncbi:MAG: succinyl-diaminopimelate desuccinylase [Thermoleophilaceae bacterium]|jgi:succinyl-diaminopimelate desuccinylase|nr:succinyl-diaminopimelate desuccinylase [Thermoleophilaceae bacterium]
MLDGALSLPSLGTVLASLVKTPSVNPGVQEQAITGRILDWLKPLPLTTHVVEFLPGRHSVAAVLGGGDGPRLVLNGHTDTVPIDDADEWSSDPFGAEVRDGYLYGRGACDMKAGLAVQLAVAGHLAQYAGQLDGTLILHFAGGEERAEPGTLALIEAGFDGDFGITTEPTGLRVATATRGLGFYEILIRGRSVHASRAAEGLNPIDAVGDVFAAIESYGREVAEGAHALLGAGSCTPTVIRAGVADNAVPDTCAIHIDRRLIPGETVEGELARLRAWVDPVGARHPDLDLAVTVAPNAFEPAEIDPGSGFAQRVAAAVERVTGRPGEIYGAPFASDVRVLVNDAGMEAVTFGPGNVAECHCADERVSLEQVGEAAAAVAAVAEELLLKT